MSPQKQVTFGDLTITEYPIIMGANPACNGCPITIGWGKFLLRVRYFYTFITLKSTTNGIDFFSVDNYRTNGNTHTQP